MIFTERQTGRRYRAVKVFVSADAPARFMEAGTGRRYNLVKRYI